VVKWWRLEIKNFKNDKIAHSRHIGKWGLPKMATKTK
jgi:hypothetical protein